MEKPPPSTELRLRPLRRGQHPGMLTFPWGCDEAVAGSVERIQGLDPAAGQVEGVSPPPPASGPPSSTFSHQNLTGAGWKRGNSGVPSPGPVVSHWHCDVHFTLGVASQRALFGHRNCNEETF